MRDYYAPLPPESFAQVRCNAVIPRYQWLKKTCILKKSIRTVKKMSTTTLVLE